MVRDYGPILAILCHATTFKYRISFPESNSLGSSELVPFAQRPGWKSSMVAIGDVELFYSWR